MHITSPKIATPLHHLRSMHLPPRLWHQATNSNIVTSGGDSCELATSNGSNGFFSTCSSSSDLSPCTRTDNSFDECSYSTCPPIFPVLSSLTLLLCQIINATPLFSNKNLKCVTMHQSKYDICNKYHKYYILIEK